MYTHLLEAAILGALLADKDRVHRRIHVVAYPSGACATEESERLIVHIAYHLLRLLRISPHKRHPAITETDMSNLRISFTILNEPEKRLQAEALRSS